MMITKYPRTPHLEGSALQPGDTREGQVSLDAVRAAHPDARFVSEEKLDGANCGIFFDDDLNLRIQSRGHILTGGAREGQFNLLKQWATTFEAELLERIEDRFILYGEWCFARHSLFYDRLQHFFNEFDIFDRFEGRFLSTPARRSLLEDAPFPSVPVLSEDWPQRMHQQKDLRDLIRPPLYRSENWREALAEAADAAGVDPEKALEESGANRPGSDLAEGLYIKVESQTEVLARFKFVREDFTQVIIESGSHWADRPIIRNRLDDGIDLFARPDDSSPSP